LADEPVEATFQAILDSIDAFPQYQVILTYPNADNGSRRIIKMIGDYAAENPKRVLAIPSLGQDRYFSAVKHASVVIGNSSSGIIEVPSFCVPTVNIGKRQKGRLAANSVLHSLPDKESISKAIAQALDGSYEKTINPYSKGNASGQILMMLKEMELTTQKKFFDLEGK
jgi:UDP-N-acetylglucosamine 2-epimerase (non-hydrolysing)